MLVVATLSDTLWFVVIAAVSLMCPFAIAGLASETRDLHSGTQLSRAERYSFFGTWAISILGLGAGFHFGGIYFGEIVFILYRVLAVLVAVFTLILLLIATSKPE